MSKITHIKAGSNCYLIQQNGSAILVDTGFIGNEKKILAACKDLPVKLIVITHGHLDHIQNAAFLSEQLHVPIAMSRYDLDLVRDNLCREMKSKGLLGHIVRVFSILSAKGARMRDFTPDIFLKEGDHLNQYGVNAEILELPGHTEGSIGIKLDDCIFVGDALMNILTPRVSLIYENRNEMLKSAEKITGLGELQIYYGHGKTTSNRKWVDNSAGL